MKATDRKQTLNEINRLSMLLNHLRKAYETSEDLEIYLDNCNMDYQGQSKLSEDLCMKIQKTEIELIKLNNKLN